MPKEAPSGDPWSPPNQMYIPKLDEVDDENEQEEQDVAGDEAEAPQDPDLVRKPDAGGDLQHSQQHDYLFETRLLHGTRS